MAEYKLYNTGSGIIANIIVWDGTGSFELPPGYALEVYTSSVSNSDGWTGSFYQPTTAYAGYFYGDLTGIGSGSFSGSFVGDGQGLTRLNSDNLTLPTVDFNTIASNDKFLIFNSENGYITFNNLLNEFAGPNLSNYGGFGLTLQPDIIELNSINSKSFTGSLFGSSSYATTASFALSSPAVYDFGSFATPTDVGGGGNFGIITDGDKGDIIVTSSGSIWVIDNDVVTYSKIQNVTSSSVLLGRATTGAGNIEEIILGSGLTISGSTISAAGGGGSSLGAPTAVITKTVDETVTNSTTLQADDHLTWNGFTSGKNYWIELRLIISRTNTSSTPAIKYAFDGNSNGYISTVLADGVSNTSSNVTTNGGIPRAIPVQITLSMTSNYTGTFLFAQNVLQSGTGITVHKGSQMVIWEVA
jgi:hypothetical protein